MKHLKDALLGLAVTALLFVGAECALWALGLGEPDLATPLSRGFDATAAYLVPDPVQPGGWVTTYSDGRFPERQIPPKSDRFRVVLFGGSNTASFRGEWLQDELDAAAGEGVYEVVNLGREGYGSERVAIVLDQAMEKLAPDLVLIYCGHNEFIERGFRMDLEDVWSTTWGRDLGEVAKRSRIVNAMTTVLAPEPEPSSAKPEKQEAEYAKFKGLEYDETQLYFEAYELNLRRMCRSAREGGAAVLLCTVVYNRFAMPFVDTPRVSPFDREEFEDLRARVVETLPAFLGPLLPREGWEHVFIGDWEPPDPTAAPVNLPGLRPCSGALADADPEFPRPKAKARRVYKALARLLARDFTPEERAALEESERLLERALELSPDHPTSLFEAAVVGLALERDAELVVRRFEDAGRYDRAPRRGSRATNSRVERVAADLEGEVTLLDADGLFASRVPLGLVGFEWMMDECHLVPGGRRVIVRDFAEAILAVGRP